MVEGVAVPKAPLVTRMMELRKQQARASLPVRARTQTGKKQNPSARQLLDQKLAITDHQIDALVYEPYGLTEAEIGVAEGAANGDSTFAP